MGWQLRCGHVTARRTRFICEADGMRRLLVTSGLFCAVLLLVGCGDDGDDAMDSSRSFENPVISARLP